MSASTNIAIRPNLNICSPASNFAVKYNCRVKYFPNDQIKISCFSKPVFNPHKAESILKKQKVPESLKTYDPETDTMAYKFVEGKTLFNPFTGEYIPISPYETPQPEEKQIRGDSIKRAIDKAFEIGYSNDFQYFITLTLDASKIDRYDTTEIYKKLRNFLSDAVKRKGLKYIIFPEYHKQNKNEEKPAIHFHGLVSADTLNLEESGKYTENGQTIFNWSDWKYGFSTLIKLDGSPAVVRYVTKYITKGNSKIFGKFYFSGGKDLKREVPTEYLNRDYQDFEGKEYKIPVAGMSVKYQTFNLADAPAI